jgi:peptide/nickel transport system permease protein
MLFLLIGISIISFTVMHLAPGDPVDMLVERNAPQVIKDHIRELYGLDQPIYIQYFRWVARAVRGDFGRSFISGEPVMKMIMDRLPYTLYLNLVVMILIYLIALPVGIISALRQYSRLDHAVTFMAFMGQSMPSFWLAMLLIYLIAVPSHGLLPTSGMATYGVNVHTTPFFSVVLDRARYLFLPAFVMIFGNLAGVARYMRSSMLEVIRQDYVRTARAKGLSERVVNYKHALRNALLPIVTLLGFELPILFSGAFILEVIFSWPGLGLVMMRAIQQRDYPVVMAFNTIGATLMVAGNFLADMLYLVVDPRIKYD